MTNMINYQKTISAFFQVLPKPLEQLQMSQEEISEARLVRKNEKSARKLIARGQKQARTFKYNANAIGNFKKIRYHKLERTFFATAITARDRRDTGFITLPQNIAGCFINLAQWKSQSMSQGFFTDKLHDYHEGHIFRKFQKSIYKDNEVCKRSIGLDIVMPAAKKARTDYLIKRTRDNLITTDDGMLIPSSFLKDKKKKISNSSIVIKAWPVINID